MSSVQQLKPKNAGEALKIAEIVLKRRNHDIELKASRAKRRLQLKQEVRKRKRSFDIKTPEKMVKNARVRILDSKRLNRWRCQNLPSAKQLSKTNYFVVRNQKNPPCKRTIVILKSLGLTRFWSGIFMPSTPETLEILRDIKPYVVYGPLNPSVLQALVSKRLRFFPKSTDDVQSNSADHQNTMISNIDNVTIEERLGHLGILCLEDLMHHLNEERNHFQQITDHVAPFQLESLRKVDWFAADVLVSGNLKASFSSLVQKLI